MPLDGDNDLGAAKARSKQKTGLRPIVDGAQQEIIVRT